ncbi:DUF1643 domain-containing protein [Bacillus mojavensis]|jgi:hypothetical protein|uniref:DUF1643 domain-containing protein n=1 Tax=Bacillus mojavensis TaxID=72360 RepID=UPI0009DFC986|nr:DUF1643 domain-containing protein [Bacillus mojavensis]MDR4227231.1 DUF1643 domain-containing protein [Bacillus mojavensis]MEC1667720.1 DUF1643 domain-containing protein [Bacillus mojavensis]MEC1678337.1 DUF1643 domain-containing protein [Bacillus mojavensis]MEC1710609.1 DUF1643 domain-containing protein [Bacillus mojavensis]MEC1737500.1 DUF1643 domain-containing protein [Bacillus mojavensis]
MHEPVPGKEENYNQCATVLLINPHKATALITDRTVMNITNFVVAEGFCTLNIVNLFPPMSPKPKALVTESKRYMEFNKVYIQEACKDRKIIIIACGAKGKYHIPECSISGNGRTQELN